MTTDIGRLVDEAARLSSIFEARDPAKEEFASSDPDELHLVEEDGRLRWVTDATIGGKEVRPGRKWHRTLRFPKLGSNPIHSVLRVADARLTPERDRGLRVIGDRGARPPDRTDGRILLVIHGTFSRTEVLLDQMKATGWLPALQERYSTILAYDYATLSQPAFVSALALEHAIRSFRGPIDVIAHSQGALVARWWIETLARQRLTDGSRHVFLGGALQGTSLAAPDRLGTTIQYFTNLAHYAGQVLTGLGAVPAVLASLWEILGATRPYVGPAATLGLGAGIELVPGLAGMSSVDTNAGLEFLKRGTTEAPPGYHAVWSEFNPIAEGWSFLSFFRKSTLAAAATSPLFADANDLVVDASYSQALSPTMPLSPTNMHRIVSPTIHHTNYFSQECVRDTVASVLIGNR